MISRGTRNPAIPKGSADTLPRPRAQEPVAVPATRLPISLENHPDIAVGVQGGLRQNVIGRPSGLFQQFRVTFFLSAVARADLLKKFFKLRAPLKMGNAASHRCFTG